MKNEVSRLRGFLESFSRIFITSHVSPDPDAICSVLLLANTLRVNFPDKKVLVCIEEMPAKDVSFLTGYDQIKFKPLFPAIDTFNTDLLLILDANNFERISRKDGQKIKNYVSQNRIKTVIIDHHQPEGKDKVDLYINDGCPATVQNIYQICFSGLKLKKPDGYGDITMLGILDDTGRFLYANPKHRQTLDIVNSLIDDGVSIERLWSRLSIHTKNQLKVISELINNTVVGSDHTHSFLRDDFCTQWLKSKGELTELKGAVDWFKDNFLRSIKDNTWGFVVYKDPSEEQGVYSVSFRAINGSKDVSVLARKLEGGGHKGAAGGQVKAKNVEDAMRVVKQAID